MSVKHVEDMTFEMMIKDYVWFDDIPGLSITYDQNSKDALAWAKENCKTLVIHEVTSVKNYGKPTSLISFTCDIEATEFSLRWRG